MYVGLFFKFFKNYYIQRMCQFYDCFGITFVWHFFECVHTLMINWYEKLLSEYFIAMNRKTWMKHLNILIRLVLIGYMHHFWGVVRDYRCWGPTRWASSLFVPPRVPPPVCRSFSFACMSLFATLSMPGLFQLSAVPHAEYPSKSERERVCKLCQARAFWMNRT